MNSSLNNTKRSTYDCYSRAISNLVGGHDGEIRDVDKHVAQGHQWDGDEDGTWEVSETDRTKMLFE